MDNKDVSLPALLTCVGSCAHYNRNVSLRFILIGVVGSNVANSSSVRQRYKIPTKSTGVRMSIQFAMSKNRFNINRRNGMQRSDATQRRLVVLYDAITRFCNVETKVLVRSTASQENLAFFALSFPPKAFPALFPEDVVVFVSVDSVPDIFSC